MKIRSTILIASLLLFGTGAPSMAQPPTGSQLSPDENTCLTCHSEPDLWEGDTLRLYVSKEVLAKDVHALKGVNCHDCHGGNPSSFDVPEAHSTQVAKDAEVQPFRASMNEVKQHCGHCHKDERLGLLKGVHAKAGAKDERGRGLPLDCGKCHGEKTHGMLPVSNKESPVFLDHQVKTCGGCHENDLKTYRTTVHGQGLYRSGLLVTAVCANCHGAHGIYYAADRRSTLHRSKVADTCGVCHVTIKEQLAKSVHAQENPDQIAVDLSHRKPSCTSCHQGHHLINPEGSEFRFEVRSLCGNCHAELSATYAMTMHGELSERGYAPAAECADCHGSHQILAVNDPASTVAPGKNRLQTCSKCHTDATLNFTEFEPHADYHDAVKDPVLHFVYYDVSRVLFWIFALFFAHAMIWFLRSLVHTLRHGRHKLLTTEQDALIQFEPNHRVFYWYLIVTFLGLAFTGLLLKYGTYAWAQNLMGYLGGVKNVAVFHHIFAVVGLSACVVYVVWEILQAIKRAQQKEKLRTIVFGPDSPVPNSRDFRDFMGMLGWFIGLRRRPRYERWTYWEKFDYWGIWVLVLVLGTSGLMLWYPNLFCLFLPGTALNVAKVVHAQLAIPLASVLFAIHCIHTHFRPEKFPINMSVLTGFVSEEHLRTYRPEYYERLRRSGKLVQMLRSAPSQGRIRFLAIAGVVLFLLGLCMLVLVIFAGLGK